MKRTTKEAKIRAAVFAALWADPKYLRLDARKSMLGRLWNSADAHREPQAARLGRLFDRACRRVTAYEDAALRAAGVRP